MCTNKIKKSPKFPSGKLPSPIIVNLSNNLSTIFKMSIVVLIIQSGSMPVKAAG